MSTLDPEFGTDAGNLDPRVEETAPDWHDERGEAQKSSDSLRLYLNEVARFPLLHRSQELWLIRRAQAGDRWAWHQLLGSHLRLVVAVAKGYRNRGLPLLDLVQEGALGLHTAIDRFRFTKGARLSTYAVYLIDSSIRRAIAQQARTIRLPAHTLTKLALVARVEHVLTGLLERQPTRAEIAEAADMSIEELDWLACCTEPPTSIDAALGDGSETQIYLDDPAPGPYDRCAAQVSKDILQNAVGHLTVRERSVINRRYGLNGGNNETLEKIGRELGVTRERVRQIERDALDKLRTLLLHKMAKDDFDLTRPSWSRTRHGAET